MNFFSRGVRRLTRMAGYTLSRCQKDTGYPLDFTAAEIAVVEAVKPFTMTTPERIHALIHAIRYLHRSGIGGDIVECGVWRGGSMMAAALTLMELKDTARTLWLYDTYEGMAAPTVHDVSARGVKASDKFEKRKTGDDTSTWCLASLEEVSANVKGTGYPGDRMRFEKGKVEDTIPAAVPEAIALLRLDTDWYESTLHELIHLWPRLATGGVLLIDDYADWQGAKKAVDEFIASHALKVHLARIDDSARMAIKLA